MQKNSFLHTLLLCVAALFFTPATAQDMSLDPIMPGDANIKIGLAGERPADISRYMLARGPSLAKVSPDGERVVFRYDVTGVPQLWVMAASGGRAQQITFGNGVGSFHWSPDSQMIVYGADNDGDRRPAFYRISADGGSESLLLQATDKGFRRFGAFSTDGERFAYASTERNGVDFDIYIADTQTGESERVYEGVFGFGVRAWLPNSELLVLSETVGEDSDNLYLFDLENRERMILHAPDAPANHVSGFFYQNIAPASGNVIYYSTNEDREFLALGRRSLPNGTFELLVEADHDLEQPTLCGDRYVAFTENREGVDILRIYDTKKDAEVKAPRLPAGVMVLSCARERPRLVVSVSSSQRAGDIYTVDLPRQQPERIFSATMAGLGAGDFVEPESLRMPARDGVMLQGLLYMPSNLAEGETPPVIFSVHGGPTGQSKTGFNPVAQYYAGRGIAVFETNVRGSTGFGRTYLGLDNRRNRLDSIRDLVDMLDWFRESDRVDADRAAVRGASYGGYAVNAVLSEYPDAFIAGASLYGVGDWVTALQVAPPGLKASDRIEYGDIREQEWIDFYTEQSPVRNADKIRVPVLYSHGANDPQIDKAETELMVRALRDNGIEAPYIFFNDEGHGWRKLKNRLFYFRREADFFDRVFSEAAGE